MLKRVVNKITNEVITKMSDDDEPPTTQKCEIHKDQPFFVHWGKGYCPKCKKWYDIEKH